ncbi:hypothetical protein [Solilutibacter pythonis]|uniref:hypothetical protein n=1 Tax=Solilutibacter pythonis TaxID=2483112 RepID=UPI0011C46AFC|nr:hypothetical protein [Lysobacter pythonis]
MKKQQKKPVFLQPINIRGGTHGLCRRGAPMSRRQAASTDGWRKIFPVGIVFMYRGWRFARNFFIGARNRFERTRTAARWRPSRTLDDDDDQ